MDALDNVAAFAERAQDVLGFLADYPLVGAEPCGEAKPLKLAAKPISIDRSTSCS